MRLNGDFHLPRMKWNAARSYGCLTGIRLFQRLGVGRERIRLQSAMRPEVELQLGGRTGSVERKSGSERAGLASPLCSYGRSITLFTFFYPRLGCARRVPPLATPPPPPSPKRSDHLSERLRESVRAFSRATQTVRKNENFTHVARSSVPLVGRRVLKVPRARTACVLHPRVQ